MRKLLAIVIVLAVFGFVHTTAAQPPHTCGSVLSVVFARVDNMGIAPRPMPGSENVFNCIAGRDPSFQSQRFDAAYKAANYWFTLYSQEIGQTVMPLPPPTN